MFETIYAKSWMVRHIRHLFRIRQDDLRRTTWACIVRDGRVVVLKPFLAAVDDHEVMGCVLRPGQIPSWFRTYWAVRRHWSALRPVALEAWRQSGAEGEWPSLQKVHFGMW